MSRLPEYDKASVTSIVAHANLLTGWSLAETVGTQLRDLKEGGKGNLGVLVEQAFFNHFPPNDHNPDFPEAGLELKTTGVLRAPEVPGGLKAKERLVLSLINYHELAYETWETASLLRKSGLTLLLFYLFEKGVNPEDRKFVRGPLLLENLSRLEEDLKQIRMDWLMIQSAVLEQRAHEISEGDTKLLGACTKSSDSTKRTSQPFSDVPAKPRAFCLKQGYLTYLISSEHPGYVSMLPSHEVSTSIQDVPSKAKVSEASSPKKPVDNLRQASPASGGLLEDICLEKFEPHFGKDEHQLRELLGISYSTRRAKNFYKSLVNKVLVDGSGTPLELVKEGIQVKTVRLESNGLPKESMSFPHFSYTELFEQCWEDSDFASQVEQRFFFIVFQRIGPDLFALSSCRFWSMPVQDRVEAEKVWLRAQESIRKGNYSELPKSSENPVSHVRPHARNRLDTLPTPQGGEEVKRCFWLNRSYIGQVLR